MQSPDPASKEIIRLTVTSDEVKSHAPETAVVSVVIPQIADKGLQSAEEIWTAFCHYSHFFTSETSARGWFDGKQIEPQLLSVDEGFALGQHWFEELLEHA